MSVLTWKVPILCQVAEVLESPLSSSECGVGVPGAGDINPAQRTTRRSYTPSHIRHGLGEKCRYVLSCSCTLYIV